MQGLEDFTVRMKTRITYSEPTESQKVVWGEGRVWRDPALPSKGF